MNVTYFNTGQDGYSRVPLLEAGYRLGDAVAPAEAHALKRCMDRFFKALVVATSVTQVVSLCSHNTFLHPRAEEGGAVEVKTFGYTGEIGPMFWAGLEEGGVNSACSTGTRQSPIDMTAGSFNMMHSSDIEVQIPDFTEGTEFENLGTTVEVIAAPGGTLKLGEKEFELKQFHFHLPSEHLDNGTSRAMEMHMVWQSADANIAVIGTYIDVVTGAPSANAPVVAAPAEPIPAANGTADVAAPATTATAPVVAERRSRFARRGWMPSGRAAPIPAKRQEAAAPAAPAADAASTLLETVFALVDEIAVPGTKTKTPLSEGVSWLVSTQTLRIQAATFEKVRNVIGFNSRFTQNAPGLQNVLERAAAGALGLVKKD
ncbi:alpha carbonic anhydrase [Bombardia bombarda]|uniref:carbonic anhydrase n=1 Tax=Bombardia bombarda TaxID=252184 RepID=A0AA39X8W4_9PEZI|nr:alpha carbonic anhydrase [Bombardia bombarda]